MISASKVVRSGLLTSSKSLYQFLFYWVIIICTNFSCKEPIPEKEITNDIFSNQCKVAGFSEYDRTYFFEFNSDSLPAKLFLGSPSSNRLYRQFEFKEGKLYAVNIVDWDGKGYPLAKLEYENGILRLIRKFDSTRRDYTDPATYVQEVERIDFEYDSHDKPKSLTRWLADQNGVFSKSHQSEFEYDNAGNLVVEKRHTFSTQYIAEADCIYEYFYDDMPNKQKQLNYLFFDAIESAPKLFSANNMNRSRLTCNETFINDFVRRLVYDSDGNVINDGYHYSAIKWICK